MFGTFLPYSAHYSLTIIFVSAPTSCFTLAVPMREVYFVSYTLRAWDSRSLQLILDVPLYFRRVVMDPYRAPEPLLLLLLDAIVLNYFYVFRKGLIQFSEGVPI